MSEGPPSWRREAYHFKVRRILTESDDSDLSDGPIAVELILTQEPDDDEDEEEDNGLEKDDDDGGDQDEGYSE